MKGMAYLQCPTQFLFTELLLCQRGLNGLYDCTRLLMDVYKHLFWNYERLLA